jgi:hypothetical protein
MGEGTTRITSGTYGRVQMGRGGLKSSKGLTPDILIQIKMF